MNSAFWACCAVTAISALVSFGYAVAGMRSTTPASRTASGYALSRSTALLAVAVAAPATHSAAFAAAAATAMVIVQAGDAVVGARAGDRVKTFGPALTAAANLAPLAWLLS